MLTPDNYAKLVREAAPEMLRVLRRVFGGGRVQVTSEDAEDASRIVRQIDDRSPGSLCPGCGRPQMLARLGGQRYGGQCSACGTVRIWNGAAFDQWPAGQAPAGALAEIVAAAVAP